MSELRAVAELLAEGLSYSQIGEALSITKNKAIGIVSTARKKTAGLPEDIVAIISPADLLVGLLDLKPGCCRYVVGEHESKGAIFCAEPTFKRSYCSAHFELCYRPVEPLDFKEFI